jgi:hypothetical protein
VYIRHCSTVYTTVCVDCRHLFLLTAAFIYREGVVEQIRTQIAKEMTSDLKNIGEENAALMRETLQISFLLDQVAQHPLEAPLEGTSSGGTDVPPVP